MNGLTPRSIFFGSDYTKQAAITHRTQSMRRHVHIYVSNLFWLTFDSIHMQIRFTIQTREPFMARTKFWKTPNGPPTSAMCGLGHPCRRGSPSWCNASRVKSHQRSGKTPMKVAMTRRERILDSARARALRIQTRTYISPTERTTTFPSLMEAPSSTFAGKLCQSRYPCSGPSCRTSWSQWPKSTLICKTSVYGVVRASDQTFP